MRYSQPNSPKCQKAATALANPVSRPWRRFLRFSVRGLIVLVLVIGAGLGWLVRSARTQRQAVASIVKAGGAAGYESTLYHGHFPRLSRAARLREWAAGLFGIEYVDDVTYVRLGTGSDSELGQVGRFRKLWGLDCENRPVTDVGLSNLNGMANLKELSIARSRITDSGLASLDGLPSLRVLNLDECRITDQGLAALRDLRTLEGLSLSSTQVTDAGLVHLKSLRNLRGVSLDSTRVTDAGLGHLRLLPKLESISLDSTEITDTGLAHLDRMNQLKFLSLFRTKVTKAGIRATQKSLPNLHIIYP